MIGKIRRLSKEKKVKLTIISFAAIMVTIVFGIVYATLTNTLTITGTADVRDSKWKLRFDNLQEKEKSETAEEITAPQIVDDSHIGDYSISLTTPGDYVSYTFDIVNEGDYDAAIGDTFSMPTPECHGIGDNALTDCENVIKNLEYTLKYSTDVPINVGDVLEAHTKISVKVKLMYKTNVDPSELPQDDVEITNLGITIPFVQPNDKKAKVNSDGTTPKTYATYSIGNTITLENETYYVIANSGATQNYVTALKATPLTVTEINNYGAGHINRYTNHSQNTTYEYNDSNNTGGLAYYSSSTCGTVNGSWISTGCTTSYASSEVKYVVDAWAADKFTNGELKTVDGYRSRLITFDELIDDLGYGYSNTATKVILTNQNVPSWVNNYLYWTMSQCEDSGVNMWVIDDASSLNGNNVYRFSGAVRPVINIYKSKISQ